MPGEAGLTLVKDTSLNIAMANRRPRIDFDTRMFVLPRGQTPAIGLSTVNLSSVKLTLARLTERNVIGFVRSARLGQPVDTWDADRIGEQSGRIVWQGSADIPSWQANRSAHTALPMPDALAGIGPRPLRADRPRGRRHAERADRRADDPAHRFRPDRSGAAPMG